MIAVAKLLLNNFERPTFLNTEKLNKTARLMSVYNDVTKENIEICANCLHSIRGKELTVTCRKQNAFKTKWITREVILRCRYHVQNTAEYLQSIRDNCSKSQVKVVIADITKYIGILDPNEDVVSF